jgi:hypothetical protein
VKILAAPATWGRLFFCCLSAIGIANGCYLLPQKGEKVPSGMKHVSMIFQEWYYGLDAARGFSGRSGCQAMADRFTVAVIHG